MDVDDHKERGEESPFLSIPASENPHLAVKSHRGLFIFIAVVASLLLGFAIGIFIDVNWPTITPTALPTCEKRFIPNRKARVMWLTRIVLKISTVWQPDANYMGRFDSESDAAWANLMPSNMPTQNTTTKH